MNQTNWSLGTGTPYQPVSASDHIKGTYEKETLQVYCENLRKHVVDNGTIESLLDLRQGVTSSNELIARLHDWISSEKSEMLWVAGPYNKCYPTKMSAIAATMVKLFADEEEATVVCHFCDLPNWRTIPKDKSVEEIGLISMVYSMIEQLIEQGPPQFDSSKDFGLNRFKPLDGNISTLDAALGLMRDLIPLCLPCIIFVVDGIQRLDYRNQQGCKEFVQMLRQLTTMKPRGGEPQRLYKVLFTTSGKSGTLMRTLDVKEILLQDEGNAALGLE